MHIGNEFDAWMELQVTFVFINITWNERLSKFNFIIFKSINSNLELNFSANSLATRYFVDAEPICVCLQPLLTIIDSLN